MESKSRDVGDEVFPADDAHPLDGDAEAEEAVFVERHGRSLEAQRDGGVTIRFTTSFQS